MVTSYHAPLPKGFAHPTSLSRLEAAFGCPALDHLEVSFASEAYTNHDGNYYDYLNQTDQPYLVIKADYHHPQKGVSAMNGDDQLAKGDYFSLRIYPVRIADLKPVKVQLPNHFDALGEWLTAPRSDIWKLHSRDFQIYWNPKTDLLEIKETERLPSRMR